MALQPLTGAALSLREYVSLTTTALAAVLFIAGALTMSQLVVEPSSLQFPLTLNKEVVQLLFVSNRSSRRTVTFKVKTTSPRRYSVRPTRGVLWPGDQEQITITLRALRKPPSDADDCRDRFKVLSLS